MSSSMSIPPFTVEGEWSFSEWLRRFEDLAEAQNTPWTAAQKLNKLKFFLEGLAREKFEQLSTAEKGDYDLAICRLRSLFENAISRNIARQGLRNCRQIKGEPVIAFMSRLKRLVTAATVGQGDQMYQQILLDEFMDRLVSTLGFHVKASQPTTVEEALNKALHMEHVIESEKIAKEEEVERIADIVRMTLNSEPSEQAGEIFAIKQYDQFQEGHPILWASATQSLGHSRNLRQNNSDSISPAGYIWTDRSDWATQRSQMIPESHNSWGNTNNSSYYPTQGHFNTDIACSKNGQQTADDEDARGGA
ncbi:CBR-DCT-10 protein [Ditylenchus destructor]|uniref:CBR-DCT-10 protein n=1 Tax=Ditylenchus destructor TaxID=166010 RepID=A0AAD4QY57_9BILA|nr:CBR-DCT-10 protein [Ditylenchus destructor]